MKKPNNAVTHKEFGVKTDSVVIKDVYEIVDELLKQENL